MSLKGVSQRMLEELSSSGRIEMEFRAKLRRDDFHRLLNVLKAKVVEEASYSVSVYHLYARSTDLRRIASPGCKERMELKTLLLRISRVFLSRISYTFCISLEESIEKEQSGDSTLSIVREIKRYKVTPEEGIDIHVSAVTIQEGNTTYDLYEVEVETNILTLERAEVYMISLLSFVKYPFNMPVTINNIKDIKRIIYSCKVTPKANGIRCFLAASSSLGLMWYYNRKCEIYMVEVSRRVTEDLLVDAEIVTSGGQKGFVILDQPTSEEKNYLLRMEGCKGIIRDLHEYGVIAYKKEEEDFIPQDADGIILTPIDREYSGIIYKIKPRSTVDVKLPLEDKVRSIFHSLSIEVNPEEHSGKEGIYEIDNKGNIIQERFDKPHPNPPGLVYKTLRDRSWEVYREIIEGKGMVMLRYHHNRIKEEILQCTIRGKDLLDVGSGQGGDIPKWEKSSQISKVVALEPSPKMAKEFRKRLMNWGNREHRRDLHIELADESLRYYHQRFLLQKKQGFSNITMFFCMSQVVAEFEDIRHMARTLADLTKVGGFIQIINIFEEDIEYGNKENYSVSQHKDKRIFSVYGTRAESIIEEKVEKKDFIATVTKYFEVVRDEILVSRHCLSPEEEQLNSMFSYLCLRRLNF